jgi:hypothetical protein
VARVKTAEMILQKVEMLNQQVGAPFALAQQRLHLIKRLGIDLAAFGVIRPAPASRARMDPTIMLRRRPSQIEPSKKPQRDSETVSFSCSDISLSRRLVVKSIYTAPSSFSVLMPDSS